MRPIPKRLLIHTVTLYPNAETDAWGKEIFGASIELRRVRMEPSTCYVKDKSNNEIQLAATLFYDSHNSLPCDLTFNDGQVLTFNGERYRIQLVEPLYDGRRLHHYELGLIRDA